MGSTATEPHLSSAFVWMETNRRLDSAIAESKAALLLLTARLERLDEHGSRGVDLLRVEVKNLREDMTTHEKTHEEAAEQAREAAKEQRIARRWLIGVVVALIVPMYPLLGWLVTRGQS